MIEETAWVVELEGEHAWVETQRKSSCQSCAVRSGCGTSVLSKVIGQKSIRMRVLNTIGARVGEPVVIGVREDTFLQSSALVYLLPLLTMVVGGMLGKALAPPLNLDDGPSILGGIIGLAVGFAWLRHFSGRIRNDDRYQAHTVRRLQMAPQSLKPH